MAGGEGQSEIEKRREKIYKKAAQRDAEKGRNESLRNLPHCRAVG